MKPFFLAVFLIACLIFPAFCEQPNAGVPLKNLSFLSHGINLNDWFTPWAKPGEYLDAFRPEEASFLKSCGFTVCRLPLAPDLLFDSNNPGGLSSNLRYVDHAVRLLLNAGLAVILDPIHGTSSNTDWERRLAHDPSFLTKVEIYWNALARHYAKFSPDRIFFEVMNEPHLTAVEKIEPGWWPPVQQTLVTAIRKGAPFNTIIATGEKWGGIDGLVALKPLSDPNVVYSFHWYEPFTFTHQGAGWTGPTQAELHDVPYPSSPEAVASLAASLPDVKARQQVLNYGKESWDINRIRAGLARASAWGRKYQVPVFCGEFGAYRKASNEKDRVRWLHDVRRVLESFGIGWAMWDYETDFGLVTFKEPFWRRGPRVDTSYLRALGLNTRATLTLTGSGPTLADFVSGRVSTLNLPPQYWPGLWTRQAGAGQVDTISNSGGTVEGLKLKIRTDQDWALSSGVRVPVVTGERFRLSSRASLSGAGTLRLEFVARDKTGKVVNWDFDGVSVLQGGSQRVETGGALVPQGVATLEPRWSGRLSVDASVSALKLERLTNEAVLPPKN
jgi:aryl-phospho-beta-D-glucosidase BglC (GH1 family)